MYLYTLFLNCYDNVCKDLCRSVIENFYVVNHYELVLCLFNDYFCTNKQLIAALPHMWKLCLKCGLIPINQHTYIYNNK